jgi:hypothetical protein
LDQKNGRIHRRKRGEVKMVSQKERRGFGGHDGKCRSLLSGCAGECGEAPERIGKIAACIARRQSCIQSDGKRKGGSAEEECSDLLGTVGGNTDLLFPATRISKVGHNHFGRGRDKKSPSGLEDLFGGEPDLFGAIEKLFIGEGARKSESEDKGGQGAKLYGSPGIEVCSLGQGNSGGEISLEGCLGFGKGLSNPIGPLGQGGTIGNTDIFQKWAGEMVKAGEGLPAACGAASGRVKLHAHVWRGWKKNLPDIDGGRRKIPVKGCPCRSRKIGKLKSFGEIVERGGKIGAGPTLRKVRPENVAYCIPVEGFLGGCQEEEQKKGFVRFLEIKCFFSNPEKGRSKKVKPQVGGVIVFHEITSIGHYQKLR